MDCARVDRLLCHIRHEASVGRALLGHGDSNGIYYALKSIRKYADEIQNELASISATILKVHND